MHAVRLYKSERENCDKLLRNLEEKHVTNTSDVGLFVVWCIPITQVFPVNTTSWEYFINLNYLRLLFPAQTVRYVFGESSTDDNRKRHVLALVPIILI